MASFSINYTDTSVTFYVVGITSGQSVRFYVREHPDPGYSTADEICLASATDLTRSIPLLSPNTSYACNVKVGDTWLGTQYFTTKAVVSINPWSWSASNGNASATQTQTAYAAVTGQGKVSAFSYLVWNDMVDKVAQVQAAKGVGWLTRYASYPATQMSLSDRILTAVRWNSLRYNITSYYSTGLPDVRQGDMVYGSYFTALMQSMNQWIAE